MVREIRPGHHLGVVVDTGRGGWSEIASLLIAALLVVLLGLMAVLLPGPAPHQPAADAATTVRGSHTPPPLPSEGR